MMAFNTMDRYITCETFSQFKLYLDTMISGTDTLLCISIQRVCSTYDLKQFLILNYLLTASILHPSQSRIISIPCN